MSEVRILSQKDVESCLPMNKTIQAVRDAYIAYSQGRAQMAPVAHLNVSKYNGEVDIKSGYIEDVGLIGTKIASGYYDNHKLGLPPGVAIIILMDLKTSMPVAIMDGTYITAYRTGAAGAVAASVLARKDTSSVGVIGAGTQGRMQILALQEIFSLSEIRVWDKYEKIARKYADEMSKQLGINVVAHSDPEKVVCGSDLIVTVTPSKAPIVNVDWIADGMHINAIGADGPGKQELDPLIVKRADKVVVDSIAQCVKIGEIQHAIAQGLISEENIHSEIGKILLGEKPGRETDNEVTLFDSTGLAAQDIAAAHIVYQQAQERNIGHLVKLLDV